MKVVGIFGALPESKELLLLVKEWFGVASETGNNSALYKVLGAGAPTSQERLLLLVKEQHGELNNTNLLMALSKKKIERLLEDLLVFNRYYRERELSAPRRSSSSL